MSLNDLIASQRKTVNPENVKYIFTIYSIPGVGKTTLASNTPNALVLQFPGENQGSDLYQRADRNFIVKIDDMKSLEQVIQELESSLVIEGKPIDWLIIDTLSSMHAMIQKLIDPEGTNRVWGKIKQTFDEPFNRIKNLNINKCFLGHATDKEISLSAEFADNKSLAHTLKLPGNLGKEIAQASDLCGYLYNHNPSKEDIINERKWGKANENTETRVKMLIGKRDDSLTCYRSPHELKDVLNINKTHNLSQIRSLLIHGHHKSSSEQAVT